jgi:hypothetical protein
MPRHQLAERHPRPAPGSGRDLEPVHQPARAEEAEAHSGVGAVRPGQHGLDVGDARALVRDDHRQ